MTQYMEKSFTEFRTEEIEGSIPARFEKQVLANPKRIAVKFGNHRLTYGVLNQAANQVAHVLINYQWGTDNPVAFLLEQGHGQIVSIMGILKAGKIYVPLDPSFPRVRLDDMLEDSQAGLILTNDRNIEMAGELARGVLPILNIDQLDMEDSLENPGLSISPDAIANILYTSGTTGKPKGVTQNHRNALHAIRSVTNSYAICPDDRIALLFSSSFAAAMTPTFGALLNGATLLPFDLKRDLHHLVTWLDEERVTIYISVPTLFRHIAASLQRTKGFPQLRLIVIGGETVLRKDVQLFQEFFSDDCVMLIRLAGTEMHRVRSFPIDKNTLIHESVVPVGYEVEDKQVLILDEEKNELGYNEVGEIAVKSLYISPGYWRKPELTKAVFLPDPEGGDERIYLTGDLGRMRPDGCLEHLGRKDSQVKIRGHRVELGEIEMAILDQPGVKETAVAAKEINPGEMQLIAYVVPSGRSVINIRELRLALSKILPGFMIPSHFKIMDQLPLTATGKVNLNALPSPERLGEDYLYLAPRDEIEEQLVDIWERVLCKEPIGVQHDFFELGGNSLLAAQLFAQIESAFGHSLPLDTLLQAQTVEGLAHFIRQIDSRNDETEMIWDPLVPIHPLDPESDRVVLFLVHGLGGHLLRYTELTHLLGPDQPIYGLQSRGMAGTMGPPGDFETMAITYIQAMRQVQPTGPYVLAGYCLGGVLAYEMARQLEHAGERVAFVGVFDGAAPLRNEHKESLLRDIRSVRFFFQNSLDRLKNILQLGPVHMTRKLRRHVARQAKIIFLRPSVPTDFEKNGRTGLLANRSAQQRRVIEGHKQALQNYHPKGYSGKLTLFRVRGQPLLGFTSPELGWDGLAGEVELHIVSGSHYSMLREPHVRSVAKKLKKCLDDTQLDK